MMTLVSKIVRVKELESGYEIEKKDGWSMFINKSYGVVPKVGDEITIVGDPYRAFSTRSIIIGGKALFTKTDADLEQERQDWIKETFEKDLKEYIALMRKIHKEPQFETVDISGMGSGYERCCQLALRAGIEFLKKNPDFEFDYKGYENVYGLIWSDSPKTKALDKALEKATDKEGGMTGAMHQAVITHLSLIHKNGYDAWLKACPANRRYIYPTQLPAPKR